MLDWLKDVLGESYSEEIDKKISAEIGKAFVSKADFNAKNEEKKAIAEQLENANKQIEEFKGMDIDGIKKAADDWKLKAEQAQKDAEAKITAMQFDHALDGALSGAKAKNAKAVKALLDMEGLKMNNGEIVGLNEQLEKVKEENEEQLLGDFWKTYRLKELYKKGKYVVDLKIKAAVYAFSSFNKNELEDIVNVPGITIHELPIDTYQDQGIEGPVYVENNAFFQPFECLFTFKPGEKFDPTVIAGVVMMLSALVLVGDLGVGILYL